MLQNTTYTCLNYLLLVSLGALEVSFASAPGAAPRRVVSLVVLPGTLAPAAPVPVESPDDVFGLPLQPVNASPAHIAIIVAIFFILVVSYKYNKFLLLFNLSDVFHHIAIITHRCLLSIHHNNPQSSKFSTIPINPTQCINFTTL